MGSDGVEGLTRDWGWGWWQTRLAAFLALPMILTGMHGTNYVFLAAPTEYRCQVPQCEDASSLTSLDPPWYHSALPNSSQCLRYSPARDTCADDAFDHTTLLACDQFVYYSNTSIFAEFNLACQEWKSALVGTIHNVGMLISLPIMGYVSDTWGRRTALVVSACGSGVLGVAKSFVTSYHAYLLAELLETILGASVYPAAFVLLIEWLSVEKRILTSLILGVPMALGSACVALLDYWAGSWRVWARVAYPPAFCLLLFPWCVPESVRWLLTCGRHADAVGVLRAAATCNGLNVSEEAVSKMLEEPSDNQEVIEEESLVTAFFKYSRLRRRLCVCFVWWMSAVFVFYGLAVRAHAVGGPEHEHAHAHAHAHRNYVLLAAAELPALLLNTLLLDRVGRRPLLTAAFLITATSLIALSSLPESIGTLGVVLYLSGKMGATMSLNALYVYTAELFPTRARHRLLAACSTSGRIGAILAPLTPLLAQMTSRPWLPTVLFGSLPLLSAGLTRLVPDTLHRRLPDSYSDLEPSTDDSSVA